MFTSSNIAERLTAMREYATRYPKYPVVNSAPVYKGSKKDPKLTDCGYLEFSDEYSASLFLTEAKGDFQKDGNTVTVKAAKSKLFATRDYSMHKACELTVGHLPTRGATINWKKRTVELSKDEHGNTLAADKVVTVFTQLRSDVGGSFTDKCESLKLP